MKTACLILLLLMSVLQFSTVALASKEGDDGIYEETENYYVKADGIVVPKFPLGWCAVACGFFCYLLAGGVGLIAVGGFFCLIDYNLGALFFVYGAGSAWLLSLVLYWLFG